MLAVNHRLLKCTEVEPQARMVPIFVHLAHWFVVSNKRTQWQIRRQLTRYMSPLLATRLTCGNDFNRDSMVGKSSLVPALPAVVRRLFPWDGSLRSALLPRKESPGNCLQWWYSTVGLSLSQKNQTSAKFDSSLLMAVPCSGLAMDR